MLGWESREYHCADCDFVLYYESREILDRRRMMLIHPARPGCRHSDKVFYLPKVDLNECTIGLNGPGTAESADLPPELEQHKERTS